MRRVSKSKTQKSKTQKSKTQKSKTRRQISKHLRFTKGKRKVVTRKRGAKKMKGGVEVRPTLPRGDGKRGLSESKLLRTRGMRNLWGEEDGQGLERQNTIAGESDEVGEKEVYPYDVGGDEGVHG